MILSYIKNIMGLIFPDDAFGGHLPLILSILGVIGWVGWIISELMALSGCQYNGVIHLVIHSCRCLGGREIHLEVTIHDIEVETPAIVIV